MVWCWPSLSWRQVEISLGAGALFLNAQQQLIAVMALDIVEGQITSINSIVNPDKLADIGPVADLNSLLRSTE
jgi:RNA polymerase sigma-70 factor, ECF subfamily